MSASRRRRYQAVVIGCSTGGLRALTAIVSELDAGLSIPVILVCHTGAEDVDLLCELLARVSRLPVREAAERERPVAGTVHVAPSGYHLHLEADRHFALSIDAKVCFVRPAIDVLFQSAADAYRSKLIGVVLTGANEDGAQGLASIRQRGGYGIVQDPADAEAPQMPAAALRVAGADQVLPLRRIAAHINELCS